jgi:hypothetical protein
MLRIYSMNMLLHGARAEEQPAVISSWRAAP